MDLCWWVWGFYNLNSVPVAVRMQDITSISDSWCFCSPLAAAPSLPFPFFPPQVPVLLPGQFLCHKMLSSHSPDLTDKEQALVSSWLGWEEICL